MKAAEAYLLLFSGSLNPVFQASTAFIFFGQQMLTALWAAQMDKITEKACWRAVRGSVLCNCESKRNTLGKEPV
ncbi:MAG: hypothetical protein D3910_28400 [Candidatus Electrothrix sp. ATG2]|nr:hypothetical protein [Candidatus Electrothrix sp. ATG2]